MIYPDKDEAFSWFFLSANQGNILANYALGHAYLKGSGINKNYKLALKSFKFSALRDHPTSRLILGNMYFLGQGVKVSYPKAFLWWRLAEDLNIDGARQNINMIKDKMSKDEYDEGYALYSNCMKNTLYNCTKKIEGLKIDPVISAELDLVAKRLEDSGWVIEEPKAPNFLEAAKFQATLWLGEFRRTGGEAITKENDPDSNFIYSQMSRRCPDTSLEKFMDSLQQRARISREWNKFFDQYPIILCPITGDVPFPDLKDLESEESFDLVFDSMLPQIAPPYMGLPGLSFATSQTKQKIPLGVQFISRKFREDLLLNVGYDLENYYPKIEPVLPNF